MIFLKFKGNNKLFPGDISKAPAHLLNLLPSVRSANSVFERKPLLSPSILDAPRVLLLEVGLCLSSNPSAQQGNR